MKGVGLSATEWRIERWDDEKNFYLLIESGAL